MPRNSNNIYSLPSGTLGEPDTIIKSDKYNTFVQDIEADLNTVRPITMVGTGITVYRETRALLYADLDYDAEVPAVVYGDSDRSYRGVYVKSGASGAGSWTQVVSYLPGYQDATAVATAVGGTANAITATISGYPAPSEAKMLIFVPASTNTDTAVTINVNSGGSVAVKNAAGNALAIGDIVADVGTVLIKDADSLWRQLVSSRESATLDFQGDWSSLTTYTRAQFVMKSDALYYLDATTSLNEDPASGTPWIEVFDFAAISGFASEDITITAGSGLDGGGDLTANRTLSVDESEVDHDQLDNFVANKHINHASVSINAGTGLDGGGTIAATRTLNVAVGTTANKIVQLDGSAKLPAVDGSQLTNLPFTQSYPSSTSDQTISTSGTLTLAHGFGTTPLLVQAFLVCQSADLGYSIGDVVPVNDHFNSAGTFDTGQAIVLDATNITVLFGAGTGGSTYRLLHNSTRARAAADNSKWKLRIKAWA